MLGIIGYSAGSTYSQEYRSISNRKKISLSNIGLTLKYLSCSVLSPGIPNGALYVLFFVFCAVNIFDQGKPIVSNKYKNDEINKTRIVIIAI